MILLLFNLALMPLCFEKAENFEGNRYITWAFRKLFRFLHFSLYYRLGLLAFLWVLLLCISEIVQAPYTSGSYGLAWGLFAAQVLFFWVPPVYALCRRRNYKFVEAGRFRPVYEGMKRRGIFTNSYLFYFTTKRLIFALLCATLQGTSHWARTVPILALQGVCSIIMCILRPHKSILHNLILIANEVLLFLMTLFFLIGYSPKVWVSGFEWLVIAVFVIHPTILAGISIFEFIMDIKQMFVEKFRVEEEEE